MAKLGIAFDGLYDGIATETATKSLTIVYLGVLDNGDDYDFKFRVTANSIKDSAAQIFINEVRLMTIPTPVFAGFIKATISPSGKTELQIPVLKADINKILKSLFQAVVTVDGLSAYTPQFALKFETTKNKPSAKVGTRIPIKDFTASLALLNFIKEFENLKKVIKNKENGILKIVPYASSEGGAETIGWGHKIETDENYKQGISLKQCEALLIKDVEESVNRLLNFNDNKRLNVKLNQNEFDAVVSVVFNNGFGETLAGMINKGSDFYEKNPKLIYKAFLTRRFIGGNESDGLIKRRAREADLFLYNKYESYGEEFKFKTESEYISAWKIFLKTGIIPILIFLSVIFQECLNKKENTVLVEKQFEKKNSQVDAVSREYKNAIQRVVKQDCISLYGIGSNDEFTACYIAEKMRWSKEIDLAYEKLEFKLQKEQPQNIMLLKASRRKWQLSLENERKFVATYYQSFSKGNRSDAEIASYFRILYSDKLRQI